MVPAVWKYSEGAAVILHSSLSDWLCIYQAQGFSLMVWVHNTKLLLWNRKEDIVLTGVILGSGLIIVLLLSSA